MRSGGLNDPFEKDVFLPSIHQDGYNRHPVNREPEMGDERPDIWIGHVSLHTAKLDKSEAFMKQIGLRPIFRGDEVAVLELRGGTHIVLLFDDEAQLSLAEFDFMVEDIDATYAEFSRLGLSLSEMERGKIHDSFKVTEPGGNSIVVNSTHVPDHSKV